MLENLTGDTDASIIKQIENYLLFKTSFLVQYQSYSFVEQIFYKSLVDGATPDSMTKLRKQTSRNRLQNQFTAGRKNMLFAGSFRVSVYSRVKIKPVAETCSH